MSEARKAIRGEVFLRGESESQMKSKQLSYGRGQAVNIVPCAFEVVPLHFFFAGSVL